MPRAVPNDWYPGTIPDNVFIHETAYIETTQAFELYRSELPEGLRLGPAVGAYSPVMFDIGPGGRVIVGEYSMLNGPRIICDGQIDIGPYCLISWNVILMDTHRLPFDPSARRRELVRLAGLPFRSRHLDAAQPPRPIRIEANVWLGFDSIVLPGVTIGEGSIVGARSVVVEDVPAYTIVTGNPARVVRQLDRA
jgi:acetyltransferase-like isoleucine patch superfamily enzyme